MSASDPSGAGLHSDLSGDGLHSGPSGAGLHGDPSRAWPHGDLSGAGLHGPVLSWYAGHARDLPWRRPDAGPWAVLVSEFMLQQTQVSRVLPVYREWVERWPTPASCAADSVGEAVRAWGRLGYPRRAVRLHAAAQACVDRHGGAVPASLESLLALPGVGRYTAAAVASFAFGQRHAVLDTNVRRVHARVLSGRHSPAPSATAAEWRLADAVLPDAPDQAARWGVAVMELGALVCTARAPRCHDCPLIARCAWRLAGSPPYDGPPRRGQPYDGTDRQCRGRLLALVRETDSPVGRDRLDAVWPDAGQRERALTGLVADGLLELVTPDTYRLPTSHRDAAVAAPAPPGTRATARAGTRASARAGTHAGT